MPKYIAKCKVTAEYINGVLEQGFVAREAYVRELFERAGGTLLGTYWAHGPDDSFIIVDMPDAASVNAVLLAVARAGQVSSNTISVFSSAEMDEARARLPDYRPPGS